MTTPHDETQQQANHFVDRLMQAATSAGPSLLQRELVGLGLREFSLHTGECSTVFLILGHVAGILATYGVEPDQVMEIMISNQWHHIEPKLGGSYLKLLMTLTALARTSLREIVHHAHDATPVLRRFLETVLGCAVHGGVTAPTGS